jgi:hypothetical protein
MSFLVLLLALLAPQDNPQAFTKEQLSNVTRAMKALGGEDEIVAMVEKRGVDFTLTETFTKELRKAGAGDGLIAAVKKASDDRLKALRAAPPIGSAAAVNAVAAKEAEKEVPMPPPPDAKGQTELIEKARQQAMDYTRGLPSFLCSQVTKRYFSRKGDKDNMSQMDNILANLSYDGENHRERYKIVTVNNQITNKTMEDLGGAVSMGEFGSMLLSVFEPERLARFQWERQGALRGRATEVYGYNVQKENSQWRVEWEKRLTAFPAYRGLVWVDRETGHVLRLTMNTVDMDKDFPIKSVESQLDYNWAEISGIRFLLPETSTNLMSDGSTLSKNVIEFRLYRKFEAESKITFEGADDEKKDEKPPEKPPKKP